MIKVTPTTRNDWKRSSPSQIKTFNDCPRKWWFDKIPAEDRPPPTPAQKLGLSVHQALEFWLNHCKNQSEWLIFTPDSSYSDRLARDATSWVRQTIHLRSAHTEKRFKVKVPNYDLNIVGVVDVFDAWGVTDYKTTSDFKWIPTEHELRRDPQCVIYMYYWFQHYPYQKSGRYQHIYINTKTGGARSPLTLLVGRDENLRSMHIIADTVSAQYHLSKINSSSQIPAAPGLACDKYGGCQFQDVCSAYKQNNLGTSMGLFDQIKNDIKEKGTATAKKVANEYDDEVEMDINATLRGGGYTDEQISSMRSVAEKVRIATKIKTGMLTEEDLKAARVNPPDGTPDGAEVEKPLAAYSGALFPGTQTSIKDCKASYLCEYLGKMYSQDPKEIRKDLKVFREKQEWSSKQLRLEICKFFSDIDTPFKGFKKTPTREKKKINQGKGKLVLQDVTPKKTKKKKKVNQDATIAKRAEELAAQVRRSIKDEVHSKGPQILLIDCVPLTGYEFSSFDQWVAPVVEHLQEGRQNLWLSDKYAESAKEVANLIHKYLETGGRELDYDLEPLPAALVVRSSHPAAQYVLGVLIPYYAVVVHGLR